MQLRNYKRSSRTAPGSLRLTPEQAALVNEHRSLAHRFAHRLNRRYGGFIDKSDIESLADLCLCETALIHDGSRGAKLSTLFFAVFWRRLAELQRNNRRHAIYVLYPRAVGSSVDGEEIDTSPQEAASADSLEQNTDMHRFSHECRAALTRLSELEQRVIDLVDIRCEKVTVAARTLGYSRGHLSVVHSKALRKVQDELEEYREVA